MRTDDMHRDDLKLETPCSMNWDEMTGNDTVRFCDDCEKFVHNLSAMTAAEAKRLVEEKRAEGLCVVYHFDASGRVAHRPPPPEPCGAPASQLRGVRELLAAAALIAPAVGLTTACGGLPTQHEYSHPGAYVQEEVEVAPPEASVQQEAVNRAVEDVQSALNAAASENHTETSDSPDESD